MSWSSDLSWILPAAVGTKRSKEDGPIVCENKVPWESLDTGTALRGDNWDYPQAITLVEGGGFGVACHLGIQTGLPCIGVAKNLLQVDGLENNEEHKEQIRQLKNGGDFFNLTSSSGSVLGTALKSSDKSSKPIYISVGHKISLESAVHLVHSCCRYRVPEPIRQADIRSREFLVKITTVAESSKA
ncbi:endonuclease V isoform X1, partial [Pelobates cultripes]